MRTDLLTPAIRLQRATKRLQDRWQETCESWNDSQSRKFQEKYLDPIVPCLQRTLSAIHELKEVLDQAVEETRDDNA